MERAKPTAKEHHDPKDALGAHDTGAFRAVAGDDVEVTVHSLRCPYCHDGCTPAESVACRDCLARHHSACWEERGRCASCSSIHKLVSDSPRERSREELIRLLRADQSEAVRAYYQSQGSSAAEAFERTAELAFSALAGSRSAPGKSVVPSLIYALQACVLLALGGLALAVAEPAVWAGLGTLVVFQILLILVRGRLGDAARGAWLWQLGILAAGVSLTPALIVANSIGPSDSAPELAGLAVALTTLSVGCAIARWPERTPQAPR
ncbi:MAG: hypothetical protein R3F62_10555 [Planctomycetota bacterium]